MAHDAPTEPSPGDDRGTPPPVERRSRSTAPAGVVRALVCLAVGVAVAVLVGFLVRGSAFGWRAAVVGWDVAVLAYLLWVWWESRRLDGQGTADHALRDNPGRALTDGALTAAAVLSLAAVVALLAGASDDKGWAEALRVGLGLGTLILSWTLVHAVYMLKYAWRFYTDRGGVEFDGADTPDYGDFAYLSYTIGMTYQVSDTNFTTSTMRRTALRHALLSYLFGAAILASAINIVAGLGSGGH